METPLSIKQEYGNYEEKSIQTKEKKERVKREYIPSDEEEPFFLSCDFCRKRKGRCDRKKPVCSRCIKHKVECHYTAVKLPKVSKMKLEQIDLKRRYKFVVDKLMRVTEECVRILNTLPFNLKVNTLLSMQLEEDSIREAVIPNKFKGQFEGDSTQLSTLLKLYVTCYYPFVPLIYRPTFFKLLYNSTFLFYSVLTIATLYSKELEHRGFYYAGIANKLLSKDFDSNPLYKAQTHLHLNFFYHVKNLPWLGWKHAGLAARSAALLNLNRVMNIPQNEVKEEYVEQELKCRAWWCCFLVDRAVSLMFDKPLFIPDSCCYFLEELHEPSEWCALHDPDNSFQSELCKHSKLERFCLSPKPNFFIMEIYLISTITTITTLNRSIITLGMSHPKYQTKKNEMYIKVGNWRKYLNEKYSLNSLWNKTIHKGSGEAIQAYQKMALHVLNNNSIILLHYPNLQANSKEIPLPLKAYETATAAALLTRPLWYFSISTATLALIMGVQLGHNNESLNQSAKMALFRMLNAFESIRKPRWPHLHTYYLNRFKSLLETF